MVQMIIKVLFRRYERWNRVHPTYGAFWGMGIGIGCGVGWGPGFGPEVIGYVGAGCGVGFSVGFTLAGFGVGLPVNGLFSVPYNVFTATRSSVFDLLGLSDLLSTNPVARDRDSWKNKVGPHISVLQRKASERFSHFKPANKRVDLTDMKKKLAVRTSSIWEGVGRFGNKVFHPHKGPK